VNQADLAGTTHPGNSARQLTPDNALNKKKRGTCEAAPLVLLSLDNDPSRSHRSWLNSPRIELSHPPQRVRIAPRGDIDLALASERPTVLPCQLPKRIEDG
jgi:hypothetical protein